MALTTHTVVKAAWRRDRAAAGPPRGYAGSVDIEPGILARGPWRPEQVRCRWRDEEYRPEPARIDAADAEIAALTDRGSPAHDGLAARLAGGRAEGGALIL